MRTIAGGRKTFDGLVKSGALGECRFVGDTRSGPFTTAAYLTSAGHANDVLVSMVSQPIKEIKLQYLDIHVYMQMHTDPCVKAEGKTMSSFRGDLIVQRKCIVRSARCSSAGKPNFTIAHLLSAAFICVLHELCIAIELVEPHANSHTCRTSYYISLFSTIKSN